MSAPEPAPRVPEEGAELLPCPLCGGEAELWPHIAGRNYAAFVACMARCCVFATASTHTTQQAIAAWNRRTPAAPASPRQDPSASGVVEGEEMTRE